MFTTTFSVYENSPMVNWTFSLINMVTFWWQRFKRISKCFGKLLCKIILISSTRTMLWNMVIYFFLFNGTIRLLHSAEWLYLNPKVNASIVAHSEVLTSPKEFNYYDPCQHPLDKAGIKRGAKAGRRQWKSLNIVLYQATEHQIIISTIYWIYTLCQAPYTFI